MIRYIMAVGVVIGGLDKLLGNRWGYGKKMEEGFLLLGPTALSMVGIICLVPLFSYVLRVPSNMLYQLAGVDPGMFGGLFAIDMGGYQISAELAKNTQIGVYAGIIVSSTLGCTILFTIPVGLGMAGEEANMGFLRGMVFGLITLPVTLVLGGFLCGLNFEQILKQNIGIFVFLGIVLFGLLKCPERIEKGFFAIAGFMKIAGTVGLVAGAVYSLCEIKLLPLTASIEEAMEVVASIGIAMVGSLPAAEFIRRRLEKLERLRSWSGLDATGMAGLLVGTVSVIPVLVMLKDMNERSRVINAAFLVCAASTFGAHLGFTMKAEPTMVNPMIAAKIAGGISALILAEAVMRRRKQCCSCRRKHPGSRNRRTDCQ
ncbi:ethanolamine utilization protein EutH [Anaerocolumna aminovalerica]|uniref:ethanolamine utilization protein EutH n=1 Tax=Anaerocolumna aminovalerica TaxID=1527 RepID=UPI001C0ED9FA|nr:ethanolamine utilization protein EutH [Anaerocolumna aminovalerica]MBU5333470.1 ethanolamine utilization protein EutH [Anaerocolumna aminovalerica]